MTMALRTRFLLILTLYTVIVLPLCWLGYGSDNDSYQVVEAGRITWMQHHLATSRIPGYWVYEAIVFVLDRAGGSLAVNLGSFVCGALILWRLHGLRSRFPEAAISLISCLLVLVPVFEIAASSADDYLYSTLCLLLAFESLLGDQLLLAGMWAALTIALRGADIIVLSGLYAGALWLAARKPSVARGQALLRFVPSVLIALLGLAPYGLSYVNAGHSFSFLHQPPGDPTLWTLKMHAGRFAYKLIYLFGPLCSAVLLASLWPLALRLRRDEQTSTAAPLCLGAVLANVALFAMFPLEISYLLPGAVFFLLLLGISALPRRTWLSSALVVSLVASDATLFIFARPDVPNRAAHATFTFAVERGPLFQDIRERLLVKHCEDLACWRAATGD